MRKQHEHIDRAIPREARMRPRMSSTWLPAQVSAAALVLVLTAFLGVTASPAAATTAPSTSVLVPSNGTILSGTAATLDALAPTPPA